MYHLINCSMQEDVVQRCLAFSLITLLLASNRFESKYFLHSSVGQTAWLSSHGIVIRAFWVFFVTKLSIYKLLFFARPRILLFRIFQLGEKAVLRQPERKKRVCVYVI